MNSGMSFFFLSSLFYLLAPNFSFRITLLACSNCGPPRRKFGCRSDSVEPRGRWSSLDPRVGGDRTSALRTGQPRGRLGADAGPLRRWGRDHLDGMREARNVMRQSFEMR